MTGKNVDCIYCGGKATVLAEVSTEVEPNCLPVFLTRAACGACGRASRWLANKDWRGLAFHARQMKKPEPGAAPEGPQDLISIADGARLVGRHPNTISTRINLGDLPSYPNPATRYGTAHPKKQQRLISKAELLALYGLDRALTVSTGSPAASDTEDYFLRSKLTIEPEFRTFPIGG